MFERLLDKIEEQRKALGDQVYDVLGDSFIDRSLRELLIEAIRYGDDPEVRARQMRIIDEGIGKRLEDVVAERALAVDILGKARVDEIRDMMERAKARKLQPGFIRAFFLDAFRLLGGRITEREGGRFEITRVPSAVRSTEREAKVGSPLQPVYERVTFEKELITVDGKPPAELLSPGHPLLTAVIDTIGDRHGALLQRGTVFVDPDDPTETPRALVYLEHAVKDGRPGEDGGRRTVSRRYQFVEIPESGDPTDAGYAPYLDYRPARRRTPNPVRHHSKANGSPAALSTTARSHAIENLAGPHIQEVRRITEDRVARVRAAVTERLTSEINYWDARAADAKAKELQGKKPKGGFTSGHARNIADDLQARLERRNRQLDQELDLSNQPPTVVGGAIVIPQGLLDRLTGERTQPPHTYAKDVEEVDRRAVAAVLAAERALQREPQEMPHHQPGYDIESRDPATGDLYFIEVKGRIEGSDTVTVKARQVRQAQNTPDRFILAIVIRPRRSRRRTHSPLPAATIPRHRAAFRRRLHQPVPTQTARRSRGARMTYKKKLIEVALPLDAINSGARRDKGRSTGTIRSLHKWFAPMPTAAVRALIAASLIDAPATEESMIEASRLIAELAASGAEAPSQRTLGKVRELIEASCGGDLPTILDPFSGGGSTAVESQRLGLDCFASDLNPVPVLITRAAVQSLSAFQTPSVLEHVGSLLGRIIVDPRDAARKLRALRGRAHLPIGGGQDRESICSQRSSRHCSRLALDPDRPKPGPPVRRYTRASGKRLLVLETQGPARIRGACAQ